jgi:amino acid transporter
MSFLIPLLIAVATTVLSYGCLAIGDLFSRRRSNHPMAMTFLGLSLVVDLVGVGVCVWWIFF